MKILFNILLVLYSFCYSQQSNHGKEASRILSEYSNEMKEKYGLFAIGSGGAMMNDIKQLNLDLEGIKKLTISEARKLYVTLIEDLINKVNNDKKARPYLHDYPFTQKNINIIMAFFKSRPFITKNYINNDNVAFIFMIKGKIYYKTYDHLKSKKFILIYEEPYEEALKIVQKESQKNVENSDSKSDENTN